MSFSIQAKYTDLTPYYPYRNTLSGKSSDITEEQRQKHLAKIDELNKSLR